jgi:hypothetical protein
VPTPIDFVNGPSREAKGQEPWWSCPALKELATDFDPAQEPGCAPDLLHARFELAPIELLPIEIPTLHRFCGLVEVAKLGCPMKGWCPRFVGICHSFQNVPILDVTGGTSSTTIPAM